MVRINGEANVVAVGAAQENGMLMSVITFQPLNINVQSHSFFILDICFFSLVVTNLIPLILHMQMQIILIPLKADVRGIDSDGGPIEILY